MKRGGESTSFRISHWLTSLLPDSYKKTFLILSPFVRSRQAMVFCITTCLSTLCPERRRCCWTSHPPPSSPSLEYSSKSHMMALNCWDLAQFWMHIFDYTTETLLFSESLSTYWKGRREDLHSVLSHVLKGCGDTESCLCSTEQQLIFMK